MSSSNITITVRGEQPVKWINYGNPNSINSIDCSGVDTNKENSKDNVKFKDRNNDRDNYNNKDKYKDKDKDKDNVNNED